MEREELVDIMANAFEKEDEIAGSKKFHLNHSLQVKTKDGTYFNIIITELKDKKYNLIDGRSYTMDMMDRCEKMREQEKNR